MLSKVFWILHVILFVVERDGTRCRRRARSSLTQQTARRETNDSAVTVVIVVDSDGDGNGNGGVTVTVTVTDCYCDCYCASEGSSKAVAVTEAAEAAEEIHSFESRG